MPRTITRDVQADVWRVEPVNGETDWFNLTVIARQLGKMLLHYNDTCSVSSSVGSVVIEGRAIPSGFYGVEAGYTIETEHGWHSPGYGHRSGRIRASERWVAYVWDLNPYIGQNLNYLLEIGELRAAPADNAETWAPIIYKPGEPDWYEHDWNNTSQYPMPNWTVSFRYDFWDTPRESWDTAYLWSLPSAHTTTLHSLTHLHLEQYFVQLPITAAPKRYLFFSPHIHLGSFTFRKAEVKEQLFVRLLHARSLRIWSA